MKNGGNGVNTKKTVNGKIYVCNKYMQRYMKKQSVKVSNNIKF